MRTASFFKNSFCSSVWGFSRVLYSRGYRHSPVSAR